MAIQKNDFVEIEFTGKSNNQVFDTTDKEEAKKIGLEADVKPMIICVGNEMLLKGLDRQLQGKEINKRYSIHLHPEEAFGKRESSLIKIIPLKVFLEKKINPYPGLSLQMDNYIVKILTVSGGRVITDFNNPLAGKEVDYDFIINKVITGDYEKVNALQDFFFRQRFEFDIKDKKVIFKKQEIKPFIELFSKKFNEITGLDFEVEEAKENKKQVKEEILERKDIKVKN
jgi:FKBP-type peptidyl-prolyl cis-trans isomerase 2